MGSRENRDCTAQAETYSEWGRYAPLIEFLDPASGLVTLLHRTSENKAKAIMENGFRCERGLIFTTDIVYGSNDEQNRSISTSWLIHIHPQRTEVFGNCTVVLGFSERVLESLLEREGVERSQVDLREILGDYHYIMNEQGMRIIPPQYVKGFVADECYMLSVTRNPLFNPDPLPPERMPQEISVIKLR